MSHSLTLSTSIEQWPLITPFRITGHTFTSMATVLVSLQREGHVGHGEAAGVYYRNESPASMLAQIDSVRPAIESGITLESLQTLFPPGGARNALDCALWDLEAKLAGIPVWQMAQLPTPKPLLTTFTCGADTPEKMRAAALEFAGARAIKLKLTGEPLDAERVLAVRDGLPHVWLAVDSNQGCTRAFLEELMPVLIRAGVKLIEQPFSIGQETLLDGFESPIPIAADESAQNLSDVAGLVGRFDVMNIKLDKCGGLTEGLKMARAACELGLDVMVGNMMGTSLAMAPAFLLGQLCQVVDLDGPIFLKRDRIPPVLYADGLIEVDEGVWGSADKPTAPRL
jgi:L-alanine-DL-glutamate epimerase-like enolase superfamily enzyme